jgi:hypothetical protein
MLVLLPLRPPHEPAGPLSASPTQSHSWRMHRWVRARFSGKVCACFVEVKVVVGSQQQAWRVHRLRSCCPVCLGAAAAVVLVCDSVPAEKYSCPTDASHPAHLQTIVCCCFLCF